MFSVDILKKEFQALYKFCFLCLYDAFSLLWFEKNPKTFELTNLYALRYSTHALLPLQDGRVTTVTRMSMNAVPEVSVVTVVVQTPSEVSIVHVLRLSMV